MTYADVTTAASLVAGANLSSGQWFYTINKPRVLRRIGFNGGAAAGDSAIEILFGAKKVAELRNRGAGAASAPAPVPDTDMKWYLGNEVLPAGQPLNILAKVVTGTNASSISIDAPEVDG